MRILGISDASVCGGAALYEAGAVGWAIDEERLIREKLATGFPSRSIAAVLEQARCRPEAVEAIYVADRHNHYQAEARRWEGWLVHSSGAAKTVLYTLASGLSPVGAAVGGERVFYALKRALTRGRRRRVVARLRSEFGLVAPITFVDHHRCHAMAAYLTAGRPRATAITLDGGGDMLCSRVLRIRDGVVEPLSQTTSLHSIGNFYAYVTHLCGFTAHKHEGKITGLAASGRPLFVELLRRMIAHEKGRWCNRSRAYFHSALRRLRAELPAGWRREDLAASMQRHLEDETVAFVRHWIGVSGEPHLVLAGGVFANVRLNQRLADLPEVASIFVHPGMGDEGLAYGAASVGAMELDAEGARQLAATPLEHVFLGPDCEPAQIERALAESGLSARSLRDVAGEAARLLAAGHVVARCTGRMEYGPRALGNRSILYRPDDVSVNDWLNRRLDRTEFMPFAPATPLEWVDEMYEDARAVQHAAQFMTVTRDCTPWARRHCRGVVHLDGTARPQYVRADVSPGFHAILHEFRRLTGLPSLINTSFNIHEEPIVCTPQDAVRAFLTGRLDYLILGDAIVRHPALDAGTSVQTPDR